MKMWNSFNYMYMKNKEIWRQGHLGNLDLTDPEPLFFTIKTLTERKRNANETQTERKRNANAMMNAKVKTHKTNDER